MPSVTWTEAIIALVALYGAGLSTYTLIMSISNQKRKVTATLTWGVIGDNQRPSWVFFLTAANPGNRTVTLSTPYILLPNGKRFVIPQMPGNVVFPHDLEEGKNCIAWFPISDVIQALTDEGYQNNISIIGVFTDALGTDYKSKEFIGNLSEWKKLA